MAGGFRPIQDQQSNDHTGKVQTFHVAATHATLLAVGDAVVLTGTADANTGIAGVDKAVGTEGTPGLITGVIIGIGPNYSDLEQAGLPASTAGFVQVETDPYTLFEVETSNGATAITDVGTNVDIVATAASASGGLANSNMTIDAGTYAAASGQFRLVRIKDPTALVAGSTMIVRVNESTEKGTVGI